MTHNPATHVIIDRCDLSTAAFWLGQLARWLDDPNHASQFSWDLFGVPEDYQPPLTVVIAHVAQPLRDALQVGPNQTVNPGPNELDTSTRTTLLLKAPVLLKHRERGGTLSPSGSNKAVAAG